MTTITREQLRERAREKVKSLEFAVTQTAFSENRAELEEELELARIALASLEAEPVGTFRKGPCGYSPSFHEDAMPLYTAPPAPVSVPAAMEIDDDFDSAFEHGKAVGWNAYRAAMLQAEPVSNSDELPLDYLQGHKDGLEWAAQLAEANHPQTGDWLYDDQIDLARAIRKGPDMPTVQGGNSPVTQDDWQLVPKETTEAMNKAGWAAINEHDAINPTYRAMLAAAPQQDVKSAFEHGMRRYAGAMQKLSEGDD